MNRVSFKGKWRIIISGVVITLVPIVCLTLFVYLQISYYIYDEITKENQRFAGIVANHIKATLENEMSMGKLLIDREMFKSAIKRSDRQELTRHLRDFLSYSTSTERAFVASSGAVQIADYPSNPALFGRDISDRPWYSEVSGSGQPHVTGIYRRLGEPRRYVFSIALPITGDGDSLIGVMVLQSKADLLKNTISHMPAPAGLVTYVVDSSGHLLFHPVHKIESIIDFSAFPAVQRVKNGQAGSMTMLDSDGQSMLASYQPIEGMGWGVVAERPEKEVFAPLRELTLGLFFFASIMLLTGGYFAFKRAKLIHSLQGFSLELETKVKDRTLELAKSNQSLQVELIQRKLAEDNLKESEERYRTLFENMVEGFAHCRMIFENGEPEDFVYISVNSAFEKLTCMKGVTGKRISELLPSHKAENPELFALYGRVSLTGDPENVETFVPSLGVWYSLSVYSSEKEHFLVIFDDITSRKRTEEQIKSSLRGKEALAKELQEALDKAKQLRGLLPICAACKKIRDDEGYWNQLEVYIGDHSDATFSHGICPECAKNIYGEFCEE
jgi:PAS domain S-box-containing protein